MLDVYRNFYNFTGEPFRLGPDHRFSLHHSSYANAKAYLEYAIFQGEGFVTITGAPGTGKTTLISEILSLVDKDKIEVSTLTSTQLESRDLLQMVAHSFGIQPSDDSKAGLLLEIESFLVRKIRSGQRAILIVDEAQGLSAGAIEELRLLANLQYEYQLLLQIILVGQEKLLKLIQQPAMEHLRQRLVAATSLEPLSLDESIDYIEHRLSRVAWKGDPGIDEGALRLMYRHSGGIPRRINLLINRLFLYGGMDEKHQFTVEDAQEVIKGLVEEYLLAPEPLIVEADVEANNAAADARRSRYLPREPVKKPAEKPAPAKPATAGKAPETKEPEQTPTPVKSAGKSRILSPRTTDGRKPETHSSQADMDVGSARRNQSQPPLPAQRPGEVTQTAVHKKKPADIPVDNEPVKRKGGKGLFTVMLLLAGAGSAYLLDNESVSLNKLFSLLEGIEGQYQSAVSTLDPKQESEPEQQILTVEAPVITPGDVIDVPVEDATVLAESVEPTTQEAETPVDVARADVPVTPPVEKPEKVEEPSVPGSEPVESAEPAAQEAETLVAVVRADAPVIQPVEKSGKTEEPPASIPAPVETGKVLSDDTLESRRTQLRRDAEQRFNEKQASVLARTTVPSRPVSPPPATRKALPLAVKRPVAESSVVQPKKNRESQPIK